MEPNQQDSMLLHKSDEQHLVEECEGCDLYNCRNHICCSGCQGTTLKREDDNRCTGQEKQTGDRQEQEPNIMDQEEAEQCRCFSSPGERYLTSGPAAMIPNGLAAGESHHRQSEIDADAELMHVLVTRPEIVGRPRDNIVFEGDMDLKTTFETSYEALAKMRLKCWKRRQEMLEETKRADAGSSTGMPLAGQERSSSSSCRGECSRGAESGLAGGLEEQANRKQRQQAVSVDHKHQQLAACAVGGANGAPKSRPIEPPARLPIEPGRRLPMADRGGGARRRVDAAVQADLVAQSPLPPMTSPSLGSPHQSSSSSSSRQQQQLLKQNQPDGAHCQCRGCCCCCHSIANKIDPDLTPIIVYDANMNRLERVGLRRRSKYRPSTSLRSGARGLFGDQVVGGGGGETQNVGAGCCSRQQLRDTCQTAESIKREKRMAAPTGGQGAAAKTAAALGTKALKASNNNNRKMAQDYENNTAGRPWDSQATSQTELALNGRNLKDSSQRDYLVFSDGNLPIDCKRKLRENVNMVDHIRDNNICEGRQLGTERGPEQSASGGVSATMDDEAASPDQVDSIGAEESEEEEAAEALISRLASQEEEAALDELQRITTSQVEGKEPKEKAEWCIHDIRGTDISEADKDVRKSRLKRTCQQQHFDISNNNYAEKVEDSQPEGKTTTTAATTTTTSQPTEERGTRYSPQAKLQTNNLFRESPDFILTTGKFMDQEVQRSRNN